MLGQLPLLTATLLLLPPNALAQTLQIPSRVGSITSLPSPSVITSSYDGGNREYDRGHKCDSDADTGSANAVFILNDGATLSNVIIGANSLEGVHCKGACTIRNVWFRDVCEGEFSISLATPLTFPSQILRWPPARVTIMTNDRQSSSNRRNLPPRPRHLPNNRRRRILRNRQSNSTQWLPRHRHHLELHRPGRRQTLPFVRRLHQQRRSAERHRPECEGQWDDE
jgi:hypothetical protein